MLRRFVALAAILTFAVASASAVPPPRASLKAGLVPIGSGAVSSDNVELLATIPDTGATSGRFVGSYFITTGSAPFPLVPGPSSAVSIYDASIPEIPVLVGRLPLPHSENEDVDVSESRRLILVSQDNVSTDIGGVLYIVDWSIPSVPLLRGILRYPSWVQSSSGGRTGGPGHIANCIDDCARYAYVTGARNGSLFVVDLMDPSAPTIAGTITKAQNPSGNGNDVFKSGIVHDVNQQPGTKNVWVTGSGGTAMLDATNPLSPVLKAWTTTSDNKQWNQFIHHNSLVLDAGTVLVTEEDWQQPQCGGGARTAQGGFQTWRIPTGGSGALQHLDQWVTEPGSYDDGNAMIIQYCSSHWFTYNSRKIVAVGWYNQGVRFLDVSNPSDIRQVGYWLGPASMASAAYFAPGRDDIVYAVDYQRGIDIIHIDDGGARAPTAVAPIREEWISGRSPVTFKPDPVFGWACARRS